MPRQKNCQPKYVYHVSGQARVYLDGRYFYLGEHDSPQSWARYYALCDQYHRHGRSIPETTETNPQDAVLTVRCVTADYREFARSKYSHDASRMAAMINLCDTVDNEYADTPAAEFGPRKLSAIRELLVATKNRKGQHNTRRYINGQVKDIVRIFERAVSRELIDVSVIIALRTLPPLKPGETEASESTPVEAVDIEAVRLTAKHLSPVIKAMVGLQVATGMRPSELFRMRPCDIDTTIDEIWIYRPPKHKTTHHGKLRKIPIVDHARVILEPFVLTKEESVFCFSPEESAKWYRDQRTANRKTPLNQGDRPGYTRATRNASGPTRRYNPQFTKDSYAQAIKRAAGKAGTGHWFPYQLRHINATAICDALGIEYTQALLGHSPAAMSRNYTTLAMERAVAAAKAAPKID